MRIHVYNESGEQLPRISTLALARAAMRELHLPVRSECCVVMLSTQSMRKLNKITRGLDRATDVLSFPLHKRKPYHADPDGVVRIGDIYIAPSIVRTRAQSATKPYKDVLKEIITHGVLHLTGYHHSTEREARRTENIARKIAPW